MGSFRSLLILATGVAIGGAVLIAYRISQETGKPLQEALSDVPAEVQHLFSDVKGRASEAMDRGREAYLEKQREMEEQLQEDARAQQE